MPEGLLQEQAMADSGQFKLAEIEAWKRSTIQEMDVAGFSQPEIEKFFGVKTPDMTPMKELFDFNFKKNASEMPEKPKPNPLEGVPIDQVPPQFGPQHAKTYLEAIEAGWGMGNLALLFQGAPEVLPPEHEGMFMNIATMIPQIAGDLPSMAIGGAAGVLGGAIAGGVAGSSIPAVGTMAGIGAGGMVGGWAGGFALPAAVRQIMMDHYEKGDVRSFADFWERASAAFIASGKAAAVGAATGITGGLVGGAFKAAPALAQTLARTSSEIAVMTTIGKKLEGQVPEPSDFLEAAITIGLMHGVVAGATKLRNTYAKTGLTPKEVADAAAKDLEIKQDLSSINIEIPRALDPDFKPLDPDMGKAEQNPALGDMTDPVDVSRADVPIDPKALSDEQIARQERQEAQAQVDAILPNTDSPYTPAEQAIMERIVSSPKAKREKFIAAEWYRRWMDDVSPIKLFQDVFEAEIGKGPLPPEQQPYLHARLNRGNAGKSNQFIAKPFNFKTLRDTANEGLIDILRPVKDKVERDKLNFWLIANHAVTLDKKGIVTGVPIAEALEVQKAGAKQYQPYLEKITNYKNDLLQYLKDAKVLNPASFKLIKSAFESWVPFNRLFDVDYEAKGDVGYISLVEGGPSSTGAKGGPGFQATNPVKRIHGSSRKIIDPIESLIRNTYTAIDMAEKNAVGNAMVDLAESVPKEFAERFIKKVKTPVQSITVEEHELIYDMAKTLKMDPEDLEGLFKDGMEIFRSKRVSLKPNEMSVIRNDKREVYEVAPGVAESMKALNRESLPLWAKFMTLFSAGLRTGTVFTPEFGARNIIIDQLTAPAYAKGWAIPFADVVQSAFAIMTKDADFQLWQKAGGINSAMASLSAEYLDTKIYEIAHESGMADRAINLAKHPIELIRLGQELLENTTRLTEFKSNLEKSKSYSKGDVMAAGYNSREITVDFQRMGAKMQALNAITAFLNVHVQGLDRGRRAFKEDAVGMASKMFTFITLPSMYLLWANWGDPRYEELKPWEKALFWHIIPDKWENVTRENKALLTADPKLRRRLPDGTIQVNTGTPYKIMKPRELGLIFGSLPEALMTAFIRQNPKAWNDLGASLHQTFVPPYIPTAIQPVLEHYTGKSTFTGSPIIPKQLEGLDPSQQFNEYTTETAKQLGKMIQFLPFDSLKKSGSLASPAIIENYVRAWSGQLGMYALKFLDKVQQNVTGTLPKPVNPMPWELSDIPFVKAFVVRYPTANLDSIQNFYQNAQASRQWWSTVNYLGRKGKIEELRAKLQSDPHMLKLDQYSAAIAGHAEAIRRIKNDPRMTPIDKKQLIDTFYFNMTAMAKQANLYIENFEKKNNRDNKAKGLLP